MTLTIDAAKTKGLQDTQHVYRHKRMANYVIQGLMTDILTFQHNADILIYDNTFLNPTLQIYWD